MKKLKDLEYIKKFSKISISGICEKNKINRANLLNNKSTQKNAKIVREEIESEIAKLYIKVGVLMFEKIVFEILYYVIWSFRQLKDQREISNILYISEKKPKVEERNR